MRRGYRYDGDIETLAAHDLLQLLDVEDGDAATRFVADLLVGRIEECGNLESFLTESRVVGQGQTEIAGAHDRDAQMSIEPEDLPQVPAEVFDVVAHAAHAKLAEVREILPNLSGVEVELLGERLRRNGLRTAGVQLVEAAQVDRQSVCGELGDLFGCLPPLVRTIHKVLMLPSRAMAQPMPTPRVPQETATFTPYVPASQAPPEFTVQAIILGAVFGLIFGASTVYLGLRAGLT